MADHLDRVHGHVYRFRRLAEEHRSDTPRAAQSDGGGIENETARSRKQRRLLRRLGEDILAEPVSDHLLAIVRKLPART